MLEGVEEAERLLCALRAGPAVISPEVEARVREGMEKAHISTSQAYIPEEYRSRTGTRGDPTGAKYPWER